MNDGITVTFRETPAFQQGLTALIYQAGLNAKKVVAKETGELEKTLIRVSLPRSLQKTRANITSGIESKFALAGNSSLSEQRNGGKVGKSGIEWYHVDSKFLRGIAPQSDKRNASVEEIAKLRWRISAKGRLNLPFKNRRGSQSVLLYQTILTKAATVKKVIAQAKNAIGRRAAGWLPASTRGAIKLTGGNMPPASVTRHAQGARGTFVDGLGIPNFPRFTLVNNAKGINQKAMFGLIKMAMSIRAKAMQRNALLFMSGKKKISDYK